MHPNNLQYIHPLIAANLSAIFKAIENVLDDDISCKLISGYRNPKEQFELFKQGRVFKDGNWEVADSKKVLTDKDGYHTKSAHNYLPSTAIDIGLFDSGNRYLCSHQQYVDMLKVEGLNLKWKSETRFINRHPHLEIPADELFQHDMEKDNAMLWQTLLRKAATYFGEIDGIFGHGSQAALASATGQQTRNIIAWDILYPLIEYRAEALSA